MVWQPKSRRKVLICWGRWSRWHLVCRRFEIARQIQLVIVFLRVHTWWSTTATLFAFLKHLLLWFQEVNLLNFIVALRSHLSQFQFMGLWWFSHSLFVTLDFVVILDDWWWYWNDTKIAVNFGMLLVIYFELDFLLIFWSSHYQLWKVRSVFLWLLFDTLRHWIERTRNTKSLRVTICIC